MTLKRNVLVLCVGFIRIGEGAAMVLSLGFYYPNWGIKFMVWEMCRRIKRKKDK